MQFKQTLVFASMATLSLAAYAPQAPAVTPTTMVAVPATSAPAAYSSVEESPVVSSSVPAPMPSSSEVAVVSSAAPVPYSSAPAAVSSSAVVAAPAPVSSSAPVAVPAPYPTGPAKVPFMPTGTGVPTTSPTTVPPVSNGAGFINVNVIVAGLSAVFAAATLL